MPVYIRRTRTITFRVSQPEFEALERACLAHGARSLSDYARAAVLSSLRGEIEALGALGSSVAELRREIKGLAEVVRAVGAGRSD